MEHSAKIIVCCAQKGGVAKTVTTHNLAVALSQTGKKVLAVDMDYQSNLTCCLGIEQPNDCPWGLHSFWKLSFTMMTFPNRKVISSTAAVLT